MNDENPKDEDNRQKQSFLDEKTKNAVSHYTKLHREIIIQNLPKVGNSYGSIFVSQPYLEHTDTIIKILSDYFPNSSFNLRKDTETLYSIKYVIHIMDYPTI